MCLFSLPGMPTQMLSFITEQGKKAISSCELHKYLPQLQRTKEKTECKGLTFTITGFKDEGMSS